MATTSVTKKKTTLSGGSTTSSNNVNLGGGFEYKPYHPSDTVTQAQTLLQQQAGAKPGAYTSQWEGQLNTIMNQINNRQPFRFDLNGNALYNQYKNQYVQQGKMAMMDTMGQAAALTGGYGNSYAQGVGQQAYQGYLQQLNDRIPELYQLALDQYDREGQDLYNRYGLISDRENTEYGRYQDGYNAWLNERDYLAGRYDAERDYDYSKYADDRDFAYGQHRDTVADQQWQMQFDEALRQYEEGKKRSSGGTRVIYLSGDDDETVDNGTTTEDTSIDNANVSSSDIKALQKYLGVTADGMWGAESKKAAKAKLGYSDVSSALSVYKKKGNGDKKDFAWVGEQLNKYIASGASKGECQEFITKARQANYITQAQANSLYSTFVPRGYTY